MERPMRILLIFPHPDDESFGPAAAISRLIRNGHVVSLLTLTRGGATKVRHTFHYSIQKMGEVRFNEMKDMAHVLGLKNMTVLDLPDSGLQQLDPRDIEAVITPYIEHIKPEIIMTYPVHGISGFHDHIICHTVVKRVYLELKEKMDCLKRLAFYTLPQALVEKNSDIHHLHFSTAQEIDCTMTLDTQDIQKMREALACYTTYQDIVKASKITEKTGNTASFEFFQEDYNPPLSDLTHQLY